MHKVWPIKRYSAVDSRIFAPHFFCIPPLAGSDVPRIPDSNSSKAIEAVTVVIPRNWSSPEEGLIYLPSRTYAIIGNSSRLNIFWAAPVCCVDGRIS